MAENNSYGLYFSLQNLRHTAHKVSSSNLHQYAGSRVKVTRPRGVVKTLSALLGYYLTLRISWNMSHLKTSSDSDIARLAK